MIPSRIMVTPLLRSYVLPDEKCIVVFSSPQGLWQFVENGTQRRVARKGEYVLTQHVDLLPGLVADLLPC